jgi:hypothetical protein
MKINEVIEHEDGSATLNVELEAEEVRLLIQDSILRAITEYIKQKESK